MDLEEARKIIIRKFTNYRNRTMEDMNKGVHSKEFTYALLESASALLDFRALSKGKVLFKRERNAEIMKRRDEIFAEQSKPNDSEESEEEEEAARSAKLPLVACYQRALKELWEAEDQVSWEQRGIGEPDDVAAYVSSICSKLYKLMCG